MSQKLRAAVALAVFLVLSFSAAAFGASFPPGEWYTGLDKPPWNPPSWLFGPVWTVLYVLVAVAAWRIWQRFGGEAKAGLATWGVQMILNALWSWLFFGLHRMDVAFAEIVALWLAILATLVLFWRRDRLAGALLVPYLLWVSFASALNWALWQLNG